MTSETRIAVITGAVLLTAAILPVVPAAAQMAQTPQPAPFPPTAQVPPVAPPPLAPPPVAQVPPKIIDELKVGALANDIGFLGHHVEGGADANIEVLFTSPDFLEIIGSPRPHIGGDINTDGNTSDGYFGLTWGIRLIQNLFHPGDGVFIQGSLGGAVHDGYTLHAPADRKRLGSQILFRESAELGYELTPQVNVSGFLDHISNANLAPRNAGITSAGGRLGFKF